MKLTVHIDGKDIAVEKGTPLLQAARKAGSDIPALCSHDALEPYGSCRLCLVEVSRGGRARLTTACNYPVLRDGETVSTCSEKVLHARRIVMELLLARCPGSEPVRALAARMGIEKSRYPSPVPSHLGAEAPVLVDCILCGLCVRACGEAIGASAISFADRGPNRHVASPFDVNAAACIGCGACVAVCPTGVIRMDDTADGKRRLPFLHTEVQLRACSRCGTFIAPEAQLGSVKTAAVKVEARLLVCPACRKRELAAELARTAGTAGRTAAV